MRRWQRGGLSRRDVIAAGGALALGLAPARTPAAVPRRGAQQGAQHWGINLAGAEFGPLPGIHGREYLYPGADTFAYYARQGFTLVRLPFKWERLQPHLDGPFASDELALLKRAVSAGTDQDMLVVLDPHNYAKRRIIDDAWTQEHAIGSERVPVRAFTSFWATLAGHFANDPRVQFGLMNEPVGLAPERWRDIAQRAILAIRASGSRNTIYVPGTAYTGAHSWTQAGNAIMATISDPADAIVIEVHQYLDADSSGTHPEAVSSSIGSERIAAFQDWARAQGKRAFLGEFGAAKDERSLRALTDLLDELAANSDVWVGCAAWAGGPRWPPEEMFNLEPGAAGEPKPQTAILSAFARRLPALPRYQGHRPALYLDRRRHGAQALAAGPCSALGDLLRLPAYTLMVEVPARALTEREALLTCAGVALMSVAQNSFATGVAAAKATVVDVRGDAAKVRCALSIDAGRGLATLCATGAAPVSRRTAHESFTHTADARIESARLSRLVGIARAFEPSELPSLVA